jgi:hypothetical protein
MFAVSGRHSVFRARRKHDLQPPLPMTLDSGMATPLIRRRGVHAMMRTISER